ncbi:hypothetical protein NMR91_003696 [Vibrio alginolyticus]|nr:hypothetical protein [Vibrio alginolyticus]
MPLTYQEIPQNAIPKAGTQCRKMLDLFMGGDSIPEQQLCDELEALKRKVPSQKPSA